VDRELNAFEHGRIANRQMQVADKRGNTCRVPVDCYRRAICLIGACDMGEDDQSPCDNHHHNEQTGGYTDRSRASFHDIILCN
jgi:hypothetical protein